MGRCDCDGEAAGLKNQGGGRYGYVANTASKESEGRAPAGEASFGRESHDSAPAALTGRSLSEFVVSSAREAAEKTIQEHEVIVLSERDSIAFFKAILNPKGPNEALQAAFRRHRELFGSMD